MLARAVRTDVGRVRLAQVLVFVCLVAGPIARRLMIAPLLAAVGGLLAATALMFWSARRSFGRLPFANVDGRLRVGDGQDSIRRAEVTAWTIDGPSARVYTHSAGWRFTVGKDDAEALRAMLTGALGAPLELRRRGTKRARMIAAIVALAGAVATATAIALQTLPLVVVAVPALVFGLATLGALSQKVR